MVATSKGKSKFQGPEAGACPRVQAQGDGRGMGPGVGGGRAAGVGM